MNCEFVWGAQNWLATMLCIEKGSPLNRKYPSTLGPTKVTLKAGRLGDAPSPYGRLLALRSNLLGVQL